MEYKQHRDLMESVRVLYQKGGSFQKAAEQVKAIIGGITIKDSNPFRGKKVTKHGENRIKKCIKYDLVGYSRLITIQDNGVTLLCFAGDHSACDAWLDRNRGLTLVADEHRRISGVSRTQKGLGIASAPTGPSSLSKGKLFKGIRPESYFDRLVEEVPRRLARQLESLESINEESDIYEITKEIDDSTHAQAIYDVFALLRQDKCKEAVDRVKLFLGETHEIEKLTEEEIARLADSDTIKTIPSNDARYLKVFEHFVKTASYMDWMLYLHPDQQSIVERDFSSPARLGGVSGSGKTCIVVKRAIRLAEKYEGKRVLILTLNRQLARLIEDMVNAACADDVRAGIDVKPFFSLCQELLHRFEPENEKLYDDVTWKSLEHIDEIWREYYRCELNNDSAKVMVPLHDSLIARNINAERYVREEFDWIRSALARSDRMKYLEMERKGRGYALDRRYRRLLLEGLSSWEKKMAAIGVTDYLGISTALYKHMNSLDPLYRCILVDESQDFGTMEYQLVRRLAGPAENDLFFCGDAAQQVSAKHRSFRDAGVEVPGAFHLEIKRNYRNSREILRAAYDVLVNNLSEDMLDSEDFEILDPEYANFSAAPPLMLEAGSLEEEIAFALSYLRSEVGDEDYSKTCLAFCGFSLYEIQKYSETLEVPVLDGNVTIEKENLYLSDLEHTKGFEFDTMVIVNCNDQVIPDPQKPEKERYRDLARFYVAMTRAKNQLIVSHSSQRSQLLRNAVENFLQDSWSAYLDLTELKMPGVPLALEDIRNKHELEDEYVDYLELSGPEFLYTEHALGLPVLLIDKLRHVIPGQKKTVNRVPVAWSTLNQALSDCAQNPRARQAFGKSETYQQFRELVKGLALGGVK